MTARPSRNALALALCTSLTFASLPALHAQDTAATWSLDEYQRLSGDMESADENRVLATRGTAPWRDATLAAIEARRVIVSYIGGAARNGSLPDDLRDSAAAARLVLIQNIVVLHVDLGNCEQASTAVRLLDDAAGSANTEVERARTIALDAVAGCEPFEPAQLAATTEPEGEGSGQGSADVTSEDSAGVASEATAEGDSGAATPADDLIAEPPALRSGRAQRIAGFSLLGLGAGMAIGGLAWDAANAAGPRADFTAERNRCPDCDTVRLDELASDIDGAKAPIGVLLFGGIAIAGTGTALWLTAPGERTEVSLVPTLGGAHATVRFGGRARR